MSETKEVSEKPQKASLKETLITFIIRHRKEFVLIFIGFLIGVIVG